MEMDRRNKIIAGAVIGAITVGVLVLIVRKSGSDSAPPASTCGLTKTKPTVDYGNLKNVTTLKGINNNMALITMAAHVEAPPNEKHSEIFYMDLGLKSVELNKVNHTDQIMTVTTDCGKLNFTLKFDFEQNLRVLTKRIDVQLKSSANEEIFCSINNFAKNPIQAGKGKHYACKTPLSYECKSGNTTDATFVFDALEFEAGVQITDGYKTQQDHCKVDD